VTTVGVVVGNPKARSRTLEVASRVATAAALATGLEAAECVTVDLADLGPELFDRPSPAVRGAVESVRTCALAVVASPTYKATYSGLLKSFLDRYRSDALAGSVGIPVMTGAAPIHALAPEVHLRPLLVELGASTPTRGLFVTEQQFDTLDAVVDAWASVARPIVENALRAPRAEPRPT
jgi:FMN reductase